MITVNLGTICHHTKLYIFFLVMRTFKSYSLSNFQICNTILLTIVATLHITFPGLNYFVTQVCTSWLPSPNSPPSQHPCPLATTNLFSVSVSLILFVRFTCSFVHGWKIQPCCHKWQDFILFYGWVVFHYIYSLVIHLRDTFPYFGYCK